MNNTTKKTQTLEELMDHGEKVSVSKKLIRALGINEAILFCELYNRWLNYRQKGLLESPAICVYTADLESELGMGQRAQRTAIQKLIAAGVLEMTLKGHPSPRRYFSFPRDLEPLRELLTVGEERVNEFKGALATQTPKACLESPGCETQSHGCETHPPGCVAHAPHALRMPPMRCAAQVVSNKVVSDNSISSKSISSLQSRSTTNFTESDNPSRDYENDTLWEDLNEAFLEGAAVAIPSTKPKKDPLTARGLYDYFAERYKRQYKRFPSSPSPKVLGIIKNGFLKKYPGGLGVEIIELLFKYYDKIDLDRSSFPRPEISTLSQDWIINRILDYSKSREEAKAEETVFGPYPELRTPASFPGAEKMDPYKAAIVRSLADTGYLPSDWFNCYESGDRDKALALLEEGRLGWNSNNRYQIRPLP